MRQSLDQITIALKGAAESMSDRQRRAAFCRFRQWKKVCARIASEDPARIAFTLHEVIDEHIGQMLSTSKHGPEVKCRSGCAACCHQHIDIFPQEAILLRQFAHAEGVDIDEDQLTRQSEKDKDTWHELKPADKGCVFLSNDGRCRVYEHRPGACRKYAVRTDPDLCDIEKHPGGRVGIVISIAAEITQSAAMTVFGVDGMAALLLRHKAGNLEGAA